MSRPLLLLALLGGTALLAVPSAKAHGIQSTLEYLPSFGSSAQAESMEVQSSFSTGVPASDAAVRLVPAGGGPAIELGHTGPDGRLSFTLPPTAQPGWEIQVDAGPGHRDYLEPTDAENLPPGAGSNAHAAQPSHQRMSMPGLLSGALTGIALMGGVGLAARLRRRS